jgi:hypothetical protein
MNRDEAVKIVLAFGQQRSEALIRRDLPQWRCDEILHACAEDHVDALMALGILKCDPPTPADPETSVAIG